MTNRPWLAGALILLAGISARSDTITTKKNLSVNGDLLSMSNGVVTLNAHFPSGWKTLSFRVDSVRTIEFNSTDYNPGAPPAVMGIGPPQSNPTAPAPAEVIGGDVIVLRGDDRIPCKLLSIDASRVYCDPRDYKSGPHSWGRNAVLRIQVDAR
jgi:hypothetical protein